MRSREGQQDGEDANDSFHFGRFFHVTFLGKFYLKDFTCSLRRRIQGRKLAIENDPSNHPIKRDLNSLTIVFENQCSPLEFNV